MIHNKDRAFWIGASDTSYVVGNWETMSFKKWWLEKMGLRRNTLQTKAMKCGNAFEHLILDVIGCEKDKQICFPEIALRINYDGTVGTSNIYEIKTHKTEKTFKITANYWRQAQVELYGFKRKYGVIPNLQIVSYPLSDREYANYFVEIDPKRLTFHDIEYDEKFIEEQYVPRLKSLYEALKKGTMPHE